MQLTHLLAFALSLATSEAVYQGFNYGATKSDGSYQQQSDYQALFKTAKNLVGTSGFSSARLYTMIQGGTSNTPTSAIPAAIAEDTSLLLGLWASAGQTTVDNEIAALKSAIQQYGDKFTKRVVGISVGSEDLYRNSVMGVKAKAGIGANPDDVVNYIKQVRSAISGTSLSNAPIGHVDTWTAWVNGSNNAVIENVDWLGVDAYPYFQSTMANSINDGKSLFYQALSNTKGASQGKDVWVTETGWPVSGPNQNLAVASTQNAKTYWDEVGCSLFGKVNTWWYTIQDADPVTPSPSFGIVGGTLSTTPLFNLTCPAPSASSSSTASSPSGFVTSTASQPGATGGAGRAGGSSSGSGSGSNSGTGSSSGSSTGGASSSASSSGSSPKATSGASGRSASVVGALGAIFAAVALL